MTPYKIQIYAGRRGWLSRKQWQARIISGSNGNTLFRSSEGYNNRQELIGIAKLMFPGMPIEYMDPPSAVEEV